MDIITFFKENFKLKAEIKEIRHELFTQRAIYLHSGTRKDRLTIMSHGRGVAGGYTKSKLSYGTRMGWACRAGESMERPDTIYPYWMKDAMNKVPLLDDTHSVPKMFVGGHNDSEVLTSAYALGEVSRSSDVLILYGVMKLTQNGKEVLDELTTGNVSKKVRSTVPYEPRRYAKLRTGGQGKELFTSIITTVETRGTIPIKDFQDAKAFWLFDNKFPLKYLFKDRDLKLNQNYKYFLMIMCRSPFIDENFTERKHISIPRKSHLSTPYVSGISRSAKVKSLSTYEDNNLIGINMAPNYEVNKYPWDDNLELKLDEI